MARVSVKRKPRPFGVGTFVAGVIAVLYYNKTESFTWWMLVICVVVAIIVDNIAYRDPRPQGVYIDKDL